MDRSKPLLNRLRTSVSMTALCLSAGTSFAATVSMPTSLGNRDFDTGAFAFATLAGPGGEFACFTAGTPVGLQPGRAADCGAGP